MGDLPLRTPTYRSLGKPLPYQLTNRTHAHLLPPKFSSINNDIYRAYEVLFKISLGYPSVKGRLHTRYAPVRRSSAECKHSLLPLDLHVLGLPLAFILSQDQTLRCINFWRSVFIPLFLLALLLSNNIFNDLSLFCLLSKHPFFRWGMQI